MIATEPYRSRAVVVTGGAGFIGQHVSEQLSKAGARVYTAGGEASPTGAGHHLAGPISREMLQGLTEPPSTLVHLAGGASVARSIEDPHKDFERTVSSTVEVLEYLRRFNPACRMVFVSSAAVYGAGTGIDAKAIAPVSPYGLHKKLAEELCRFYSDSYSIQCSIVRPFSVYGPGLRKQLLWDALRKVDSGKPEFFGTGEEIRDWVFVEDLARLILMMGQPGPAFALDPVDAGTAEGVTVKQILTRLLDLYSPGVKPVFLGTEKRGDPSRLVAGSVDPRVKAVLCGTSLASGLESYVAWYRQERGRC